MTGTGLGIALVLAKLLGVAGHELPWSAWLPARLFWDDVAAGVAFAVVRRTVGPGRTLGAVYWLIVVWAAINVPVVRALSSPLTARMLGATGGPLLDSIVHYVTPANVACIAAVVSTAWLVPRLGTRAPLRQRSGLAAVAIIVVVPGPFLGARVETNGLDRSALSTLVRTSLVRVPRQPSAGDWRRSPIASGETPEVSGLRGAARGRNVVLIVLESTASRYLRSYGAVDDPTPNLSGIAANALQFSRAYAAYPESIKGLFALLCARYPAFDVSAGVHASAPCAPLAGTLGRQGYRTALFHSGRFAYLGMDAVVARQAFEKTEDAGAIGGNAQSSFGVDEPSAVKRVLAWIDSLVDSERFFVTYLPAAGHHPYATFTPGPFVGTDDITAYKNALYEGDVSVGALVNGLRARGRYNDTLFVFIGDHGQAFGQHSGNYGHSLFLYDENIRVPLIFAAPGLIAGRTVANRVASVVDVAPTILDLLGVQASGGDGRSLLSGPPTMALFFTDYSTGLLGLQDGCSKFIFDMDTPRARLFDTCKDPDERHDSAATEPERLRLYREHLRAWSSATRDAVVAGR